jgi:hypothetical protein
MIPASGFYRHPFESLEAKQEVCQSKFSQKKRLYAGFITDRSCRFFTIDVIGQNLQNDQPVSGELRRAG